MFSKQLRPQPLRCLRASFIRHNSTAPSSPLLAQIKADLKGAMRAKDTAKLNVLRSIISETNNLAKSPSPITSDIQLLSLLRKRTTSLREACAEFAKANREDLQENARKEMSVVEEYAAKVETMSEEEVEGVVRDVMEGIKAEEGRKVTFGVVIGELFKKGGPLDGKPVLKSEVVPVAKRVVNANAS